MERAEKRFPPLFVNIPAAPNQHTDAVTRETSGERESRGRKEIRCLIILITCHGAGMDMEKKKAKTSIRFPNG